MSQNQPIATGSRGRQPLPEDHPCMLAWRRFEQSNAYKAALYHYGTDEDRASSALWLAFSAAWMAQDQLNSQSSV